MSTNDALTEETYYSDRRYFSVSRFKSFQKCSAATMAELNNEWIPSSSRALLLGSYMDELLTGTKESQQKFILENSTELFKKNGTMYADIDHLLETYVRIQQQPLMMHYLSGEHQRIMTGEIEGVPFKIKMDSYKPGEFIADLKYMASLRAPNMFTPMVEYWGYDIQAACYQEIVRQNTGEKLPFFFVVATKENPAHLEVGQINQLNIETALDKVRKSIKRYWDIYTRKDAPERCEEYGCDYCTSTKRIVSAIDTDLFGLSTAQLKAMNGEMDDG